MGISATVASAKAPLLGGRGAVLPVFKEQRARVCGCYPIEPKVDWRHYLFEWAGWRAWCFERCTPGSEGDEGLPRQKREVTLPTLQSGYPV
jgi:hypothetical protein